jgi:three-Cys-motif partner protein
MGGHTFGGEWTEDKLACLGKYLSAYRKIFAQNKYARRYRTWYVDAFAGTGSRAVRDTPERAEPLFEGSYEDPESQSYRDGSAIKALGLESTFDKYFFIEKSKARLKELETKIEKRHDKLLTRCEFSSEDANKALRDWSTKRDWKNERAVVFLDPYGMQVEWKTLKTLAATKAIDLWYLFPLGIGVARLLVRDGKKIDEEWERRLDLMFGTNDWKARFYEAQTVRDLFGPREELIRDAGEKKIAAFVEERLKTCFVGVAKGLILRNSKSSPLYLLCFAASNERGAAPALKIAQSILGRSRIMHR